MRDLVQLLGESGVSALDKFSTTSTTADALRTYVASLNGSGALDREVARGAAVRDMKAHGVRDAYRLARAAFAERATASSAPAAALQGHAVTLADPEPWPEPVDGAALVGALAQTFARFVALPEGAATTLALWTMHAHAHEAAQVSPLLGLSSPEKRSAKTTTLTVLGALGPRPLWAASISPAALFRAIERFRPLLLVDEADRLREAEELRLLLNASHNRASASVVRTVGDDFEPRTFSTWGPKALALIGELPGTLEDRSIVLRMRRRRSDERVERLRLDRLPQLEPLRRQAWTWAQAHLEELRGSDPTTPDGLHDRAADNWRPLLAIADCAGGAWPSQARVAAMLLSGGAAEGERAPAVQLLADLREVFTARASDRLASADLVGVLTQREDRPWPEWKRGKPLSVRQLAKLLGRFGVQPTQLWIAGVNVRGYERVAFEDAWARYLPSDPLGTLESKHGTTKSVSEDPLDLDLLADRETSENADGASGLADLADESQERDHALEAGPGLERDVPLPEPFGESPDLDADPDVLARDVMREGT